jgi:hypothetical protein
MSNRPLALGVFHRVYTARSPLFMHALCVLLVTGVALFVSVVNIHTAYDDAFVTYRYAYNLATGNGFVYNHGEGFLGTTAPLYGILLGVLGILNPDAIPLISGGLSSISLLLCGLALYVYGRHHGQAFCGLLAGIFFVANPLLPLTFGGEMLFQVALVAWAFALYAQGRSILAAFLVALAMLTRADGILAAGVLGVHSLWTQRRLPWREMLVIGLTILPFVLLSWWFYGTPLPGTLEAKLAHRDSGLWPGFSLGLFEWIRAFTIQGSSVLFPTLPAAPYAIRFILFTALGLPAVLLFRFWLLPLSWVALFTLGYHILDVPFYHWYIVPVIFGLMILAATGIAGVLALTISVYRRFMPTEPALPVAAALYAVTLLVLLPGMAAQLAYTNKYAALQPNPAVRIYEKTGRWLQAHTPPDASVGYFEIGYVGYYSQRTMIDPLALVNPGLASHVARGDLTWAYEHYRPDYIVHNPAIFVDQIGVMTTEPWFIQEYREVAQIEQAGYPSPLIVYQQQSAADR